MNKTKIAWNKIIDIPDYVVTHNVRLLDSKHRLTRWYYVRKAQFRDIEYINNKVKKKKKKTSRVSL